ncbi:MAG: protease SohB [Proteobacteria bacterium]|nr:protease SohB [Pseudomonadota bacterium]
MHFFSEYSLFLLKAVTVVIAILIIIGGAALIASFAKNKEKNGRLTVQKINNKFNDYQKIIGEITHTKAEKKQAKKNLKITLKDQPKEKPRLFVLNFHGDIKASAVNSLREEVTAVLLSRKNSDQVLICIESPGGLVHSYGLAAAQIQRLKDANIKTLVAVDKVAASGGYLMACLADHLMAAPFAIIGSVGVIAQLPNFHRWLEKNDIDYEQVFAGQYKRTLTLFGKNTPEGREKMQEELNDAHELFKEFIVKYRPQVSINQIATGEHWFASRALQLKLLDEIKTSDQYLQSVKDQFDIYQVKYEFKKTLSQRLGASASSCLNALWRLENGY